MSRAPEQPGGLPARLAFQAAQDKGELVFLRQAINLLG